MSANSLALPWAPSVNGYWRAFRGRQILSKKGRVFRDDVLAAQAFFAPDLRDLSGRLEVTLELWAPDNRRRDIDNYIKAPLDALTHADVWGDDSQVDALHVYRRPVQGKPGKVLVTIEEL